MRARQGAISGMWRAALSLSKIPSEPVTCSPLRRATRLPASSSIATSGTLAWLANAMTDASPASRAAANHGAIACESSLNSNGTPVFKAASKASTPNPRRPACRISCATISLNKTRWQIFPSKSRLPNAATNARVGDVFKTIALPDTTVTTGATSITSTQALAKSVVNSWAG